jgi:uncharacterized protein YecT (DUF1311 family)
LAAALVRTYVSAGDRCLSACAMAWLGGSNTVMRGLPPWPQRYVHETAIIGFHAPFTDLLGLYRGMDQADIDVGAVAVDFYEYARLAISEVASRIAGWEVDSDFVFDMLSAGPASAEGGEAGANMDLESLAKNFVLIDTAARLDQVQGVRVGPAPGYPVRLNAVDAAHACAFVHIKNIQPGLQRGYSVNLWPEKPEVTADGASPAYVVDEGLGAPTRTLVPASGPNSFFFTGIEPGLGPWQCNVFLQGERWFVQTNNANLHFLDPETGKVRQDGFYGQIFDADAPYPVNGAIRLGWDMSWLAPRRHLYAGISGLPQSTDDVTKASFDCGGALDPAAEAICSDPVLQRLDGAMVRLYLTAREIDPAQRETQRAWLVERDVRCRPDQVTAGMSSQLRPATFVWLPRCRYAFRL